MTKDQLKRRIQDLARQVYSATTVTPEEATGAGIESVETPPAETPPAEAPPEETPA